MQFRMILPIFGLLSVLLAVNTLAGTQPMQKNKLAQGTVFEDANNNGLQDKNEKGIPGVLVSNQKDVVRTDAEGRYEIPVDDETIVFITKPAGYSVPLDENNLPQFFYIHQPKGSPALKYKGVEPTGKLPKMIDFPLIKDTLKDSFDVLVFADTQPLSATEVDFVRDDVIAELVGIKTAFGVTLGDIMFDNLDLFARQNQVIAKLGIPFYNVPGNHDMNYDAAGDRYSLETFKRHFGPNYFSFDYGKVHFIALDDVEYQGRHPETGAPRYQGLLGEKQLAWLENDLRMVDRERLVVLMMHIPLFNPRALSPQANVMDRDKLFSLLKNRESLLAIAGHLHQFRHDSIDSTAGWQGETPLEQISCAAVCGSWWSGPKDVRGIPDATQIDGTPNGYHIFNFNGTNWTQKYYAAGHDPDDQMRIVSPAGSLNQSDLDSLKILVNVFSGTQDSEVTCSIDGGPHAEMVRVTMKDPFFERMNKTRNETFKPFVRAAASEHMWIASFPENLKTGMHVITVKAVDRYSKNYTSHAIFEVK